jgi:hypothetical protein
MAMYEYLSAMTSASNRAHDAFRATLPRHSQDDRMTNSVGSETVASLEAAWRDIQARHPEVPDVMMITGSGANGSGLTWGHFSRERWEDSIRAGKLHELFISGERLACGAELTTQTLLHEAVHALGAVREISNTSRQGRYHNGRFRTIAEEVGLTYPHDRPDSVHGYSAVELTDETKDAYASTIKTLDTSIHMHIPSYLLTLLGGALPGGHGGRVPGLPTKTKGTGGSQRLKLTCQCDPERIIYTSTSNYDFGGIMCEVCDSEFLSRK